jgi:hypothetical protein
VDGVGEGYITIEKAGSYWNICLRKPHVRKTLRYIKVSAVKKMVEALNAGKLWEAQCVALGELLQKYHLALLDENHMVRDQSDYVSYSLSMGVWIKARRMDWEEYKRGVLIIKRKSPRSYAYYLAEKVSGKKYKHHYLTKAPYEHIAYRNPRYRMMISPVIRYLESRGIDIVDFNVVVHKIPKPNWLIRKREEQGSIREDEGILGEAQEKAETWGWEQVRQDYLEDGDTEALDELEEYWDEEDEVEERYWREKQEEEEYWKRKREYWKRSEEE